MNTKNKTEKELTKCFWFILRADDGCFYVGLGNNGKSKRGGAPAEYRPFQCCPTKLEKSTRVPKMTAAKIGESAGARKAGGNFKFSNVPSKVSTTVAASKDKKGSTASDKNNNNKAKDKKSEEKGQKKGSKVEETKVDKKKQAVTKGAKAGNDKGKAQKGMFSIDWW